MKKKHAEKTDIFKKINPSSFQENLHARDEDEG